MNKFKKSARRKKKMKRSAEERDLAHKRKKTSNRHKEATFELDIIFLSVSLC